MDVETQKAQILDLVGTLFEPADRLEVRLPNAGGGCDRSPIFIDARDVGEIVTRIIADNLGGRHAFFSVCPRSRDAGGADAVALARFQWADFDDRLLMEALEAVKAAGLPMPTLVVQSGRGCHVYWLLDQPQHDLVAWAQRQRWIAYALAADPKIANGHANGMSRLAGTLNPKPEAEGRFAEIVENDPDRRYRLDQLVPSSAMPTEEQWQRFSVGEDQAAAAAAVATSCGSVDVDEIVIDGTTLENAAGVGEGQRNTRLAQLVGQAFAAGLDESTIREQAAAFGQRCQPTLPARECHATVTSIGRKEAARRAQEDERIDAFTAPEKPWPSLPKIALRHGILPQLLEAVMPFTEADEAGVAAAFLVAFGNVAGRQAHTYIGATRHGCNEFACLTGTSSRGRKGTSTDAALLALATADPVWHAERIQRGLVSGEGLVDRVSDPQMDLQERKPPKGSGLDFDFEFSVGGGSFDKRLLALETEFASVFRASGRRESTLSPVLRQAWDGSTLETLAKTQYRRADDAHVSVIGNAVADEIARVMSADDRAGGTPGRVLWIATRRSKLLPNGGHGMIEAVRPVQKAAEQLVAHAQDVQMMDLTPAAADFWASVYAGIATKELPGLPGACINRGEAHCRRLAMIFALLRRQRSVGLEDMVAAVDFWGFCDASAQVLFSGCTTEPLAVRILDLLRARQRPLSKSEIHRALSNNAGGEDVARAVDELVAVGAVTGSAVATGRPGRPRTEFRLTTWASNSPPQIGTKEINNSGEVDELEQPKASPADEQNEINATDADSASDGGNYLFSSYQSAEKNDAPPAAAADEQNEINPPAASAGADVATKAEAQEPAMPQSSAGEEDLPPPDFFCRSQAEPESPPAEPDIRTLADGSDVDEITIAKPKRQQRRRESGGHPIRNPRRTKAPELPFDDDDTIPF